MPTRKEGESKKEFVSRCMGDSKMNEEFPESDQRYAVCNKYAEEPVSAGMEDYIFSTPEGARKKSREIGFDGKIHSDEMADGTVLYFPGPNEQTFQRWFDKNDSHSAQETLEALQYGRPKKNDPRKTPAKPNERRKGSKKNKPGSAKKPNNSISFSKETESRLRELMRKHNAKNKGSKASMGMLKTVYRRGAGAFSKSHAPNMSRGGWGVARVKAFLYLLRNGRPSNPNYKQDNDLLPKSHPRASEEYIFKSIEAGIEDMDYQAAEYKGKKVKLNKPFRTSGGAKKFAVYVQNESGRVVIVRFGDPNMEIKRDDPGRRKNFRSRHNCDTPGPKTKARYWSCRMWERSKSVTDYTSEEHFDDDNELDLTYEELWEQNEEQPIFEDIEEVGAEEDCGCGCGDCAESVEAKMIRKDVYDNPGEAAGRAKELGLDGTHTLKEDGETYFMPGKTHEEYMKKVGGEKKVEGYKHKDEKKAEYDSCPSGEEMKGGKCVRVAVTLDAIVNTAEAIVEASTGKSVVKISGVAFHEGMNKNYWEIAREGADNIVSQMVGADITLNHPKAEHGRFKRNMAGLDEGVIGRVSSASIQDKEDGKWEVRFVGTVERSELFEVLESGLWLREGYGVSIGGTGVPDKVVEATDGRSKMVFSSDFTFDHLAIVHKPAYSRAKIDEAVKVNEAVAEEMFIGEPTQSHSNGTGLNMTDEQIETATASEDLAAKMAELEKALVLANSRVAGFEETEKAREEELRMGLVHEASEAGLKGHEALPADTIKELLAAWKESKPAAREMKPVEPASTPAIASESSAVVANYLNGKMVKTPEDIYMASFNSLVAAYNRGSPQRDHAPTYEEAKNKGLI